MRAYLSSILTVVAVCLPATAPLAQELKMKTVYQCQPPYSIEFLSCTGSKPNDTCDTQSFNAGRPFMRGRSTYAQVMTLLPRFVE